jgi:hypothetical protein
VSRLSSRKCLDRDREVRKFRCGHYAAWGARQCPPALLAPGASGAARLCPNAAAPPPRGTHGGPDRYVVDPSRFRFERPVMAWADCSVSTSPRAAGIDCVAGVTVRPPDGRAGGRGSASRALGSSGHPEPADAGSPRVKRFWLATAGPQAQGRPRARLARRVASSVVSAGVSCAIPRAASRQDSSRRAAMIAYSPSRSSIVPKRWGRSSMVWS